jgi:hypothetical protein
VFIFFALTIGLNRPLSATWRKISDLEEEDSPKPKPTRISRPEDRKATKTNKEATSPPAALPLSTCS